MNRGFPDWIFRRLTGVVAWALFASVLSLVLGLLLAPVPVFLSGWDGQEGGGPQALDHPGKRLSLLLLGTAIRTLLMSVAAIPAGILTAVYLAEYAPSGARATRILRWLVHGLAGVPSVINCWILCLYGRVLLRIFHTSLISLVYQYVEYFCESVRYF